MTALHRKQCDAFNAQIKKLTEQLAAYESVAAGIPAPSVPAPVQARVMHSPPVAAFVKSKTAVAAATSLAATVTAPPPPPPPQTAPVSIVQTVQPTAPAPVVAAEPSVPAQVPAAAAEEEEFTDASALASMKPEDELTVSDLTDEAVPAPVPTPPLPVSAPAPAPATLSAPPQLPPLSPPPVLQSLPSAPAPAPSAAPTTTATALRRSASENDTATSAMTAAAGGAACTAGTTNSTAASRKTNRRLSVHMTIPSGTASNFRPVFETSAPQARPVTRSRRFSMAGPDISELPADFRCVRVSTSVKGFSTETELKAQFARYATRGSIVAVRIDMLAGTGYVQFADASDARDAQRTLSKAGTECSLASTGSTKRL